MPDGNETGQAIIISLTTPPASVWFIWILGLILYDINSNPLLAKRQKLQAVDLRSESLSEGAVLIYSTVTDLARLRGMSTLQPLRMAIW